MNPYLEIFLVVSSAVAAALILCALIGGVWFAIQPSHEADHYELPIPADREFSDSVSSVPSVVKNHGSLRPSRSSVDCAPVATAASSTDNQTAALALKHAK